MIILPFLEVLEDVKEIYFKVFGSLWWWPIMMLVYITLIAIYRPQGQTDETQ
tara:strand:- start:860 stop:1015 length:156 start_codon:yes stop_codon:yes gene_type:complete